MENKINIAELLKDCPCGMELDCTCADNVVFDKIIEYEQIKCVIGECRDPLILDKYGRLLHICCPKCVIFPKGKNTWVGFHRPFKDGDIVAFDNPHRENLQVFVFKNKKENNTLSSCYLMLDGDELVLEEGMYYITRLATEEEKQKLFDTIKENGYHWNAETKTLEKLVEPRFKVGDRVRSIYNGFKYDIKELTDTHYTLVEVECKFKYTEPIIEDKNWELVPNKFDINTLKPFDKVLTRANNEDVWVCNIFSHALGKYHVIFVVLNAELNNQCIPFNDETKHLVGTTDDCDEYYKTWE